MYSDPPGDARASHPFHMYDEITAQPEAVRRALQESQEHGVGAVRALAGARRIFVAGCGTSFHAAQCGAWFLEAFSAGKLEARAVQAYELLTYQPGLRPDDVVIAISHSGTTTMVRRVVDRAHRSGAETVAVTGFPESPLAKAARYVVPTGYAEERSWAHTVSYTASLTTLASLANDLATPEERLDLTQLPDVMADALTLEEMARRVAASTLLAERFREPSRIVIVGAGPNVATASEAKLKLLETSYVAADAFELEEMLHGPLAAVTQDSLLIVLAPAGRSTERLSSLVWAARELGTAPVVLSGSDNADAFEEAHRLLMPDLPEILSPIPYVVPLQLFSYFLAAGKGINPDLIHRDDERYRAARARYE